MSFIVESNSLERHRFKKMFNKKNSVIAMIVILVLLLVLGYLYEQGEARTYLGEVQGKTIKINQVNYNYELYGQGDYTVIINGSAGETLLNREALKDSFQGNARLLFYDRPGYPASDGEFKTPEDVAKDLHFMFRKFGFEMNFIFVGEEYGSLVMEEYIHLYPEEVIGAIFINPLGQSLGSEEMMRYVNRETASFFSKTALGYVGLPRFMQNLGIIDFYNQMTFRSKEEKENYANVMLSREMMTIVQKELNLLNDIEPLALKPSLLGDSPLIVMTSEKNKTAFNQDDYLLFSEDSELFVYADSIKDLVFQQPEDIVSMINGIVDKLTRQSFR